MIAKLIALNWRIMKTHRLEIYLMPVIFILLGWLFSPLFVFPLSAIMAFSYSANPFLIERKVMEKPYLTLPLTRSHLVLGKYALSFVMLTGCILISFIVIPILNLLLSLDWNMHYELWGTTIVISFLTYAFLSLIVYPLLFWCNSLIGSNLALYIPLFIFGLSFGFIIGRFEEGFVAFIVYALENKVLVNGTMLVSAILILLASYALSVRIYAKRDF